MQISLPIFDESKPARIPTLLIKEVNKDYVGIRFRQIGNPQRFQTILQRFRFDFPLAVCQHLYGQPWWIVASSQRDQVEAFSKRNGLQISEEP